VFKPKHLQHELYSAQWRSKFLIKHCFLKVGLALFSFVLIRPRLIAYKTRKCDCGVSRLLQYLLKSLGQIQGARVPLFSSWNQGFLTTYLERNCSRGPTTLFSPAKAIYLIPVKSPNLNKGPKGYSTAG